MAGPWILGVACWLLDVPPVSGEERGADPAAERPVRFFECPIEHQDATRLLDHTQVHQPNFTATGTRLLFVQ